MEEPIPPTVEWRAGTVRLVDQRQLPDRLAFVEARTVDELCDAIRTLAVRGAPALGVAGAMGVALAKATGSGVEAAARSLIATRPTAVNLSWGVRRAASSPDPLAEALRIQSEDLECNRRLGAFGAALLASPGLLSGPARILTHCNAGAMACAGYGTALGIVRAAHEQGLVESVWVDETRPLLQGSRITAWELDRLGVKATVVVDSAAGSLMAAGRVDCVVVGADRVAANGDVANKVGTYSLAVLARHHGVPFYVAAPTSTVDLRCASGAAIEIETRDPEEVAGFAGRRTAPPGVAAYNPAFDVTPAALVTAIVTDAGVVTPPYAEGLARVVPPPSLRP